jgi:Fe-S cluster assembly protein SufD
MPDVPAFAADVVAALPGSAGLSARRVAAAEAFAAADLPTVDEEVWRYSRVGDLDLARYEPALVPAPGADAGEIAAGARAVLDLAAGLGSVALVTVDGHLVHTGPLGGRTVDGLITGLATDADAALLDAHGEPADAFGLLADAFARPIVVRVPPGAAVDPVVIVHWISRSGVAAFPRVVVDAGADCDVTVLEVLRSADDADALVVTGTDLVVGKAARVGHLVVQDLSQATWQLGTQRSTVDADATLTATAAAFGGAYARQRTDCRLVGRGATGALRAVWFGEADQHLDFRTFQDHAAPDTTSDLVYKGAVGGRSRSVYTGLIKVRKEARGTNAIQTNRNLKLSDDAWAESVPNLEIENNDVRCAHASAVGPVDEEQRWYVESRGVPTAVAERLIVAGFFDEVIGDLPVPAATEPLRALVNGKLDRTDRTGGAP